MKKDGSSLELFDATGTSVAKGGLDPADDTRMVVDLDAPLVAGVYTVKWTSVADGRTTSTAGSGSSRSPQRRLRARRPFATSSAAPAQRERNGQPNTDSDADAVAERGTIPLRQRNGHGGHAATSLLPIIVALILLGGGAAYLLNRRNRPTNPA